MVNIIYIIYFFILLNPILIYKKNKNNFLKKYLWLKSIILIIYILIINYYCIFQLSIFINIIYILLPILIIFIIDHIVFNEDKHLKYLSNLCSILIIGIFLILIFYPILKNKIIYNNLSIAYIESFNNTDIKKLDKNIAFKHLNNYIEKNENIIKIYNDSINNEIVWVGIISNTDNEFGRVLILDEKFNIISICNLKISNTKQLKKIVYNEYPYLKISNFTIQFDDNFNPFFIIPYFNNTKVEGIITINALTSNIIKYDLNDKNFPQFVNFILNEKEALSYLKAYTKRQNGIIEIISSKNNSYDFNENNLNSIFINNSKYWIIDIYNEKLLTSEIILINSINGEFQIIDKKVYNSKVFLSIIDKYSNEIDEITSPILYNIYGDYLWISKIISQNGSIKNYIAMHAVSGDILIANDINSMLYNYKLLLQTQKILGNYENNEITISKIGKVERINFINNELGLLCIIKLYNDNNLYIANTFINKDLLITSKNDTIKIFYEKNSNEIIILNNIINYTIK